MRGGESSSKSDQRRCAFSAHGQCGTTCIARPEKNLLVQHNLSEAPPTGVGSGATCLGSGNRRGVMVLVCGPFASGAWSCKYGTAVGASEIAGSRHGGMLAETRRGRRSRSGLPASGASIESCLDPTLATRFWGDLEDGESEVQDFCCEAAFSTACVLVQRLTLAILPSGFGRLRQSQICWLRSKAVLLQFIHCGEDVGDARLPKGGRERKCDCVS